MGNKVRYVLTASKQPKRKDKSFNMNKQQITKRQQLIKKIFRIGE